MENDLTALLFILLVLLIVFNLARLWRPITKGNLINSVLLYIAATVFLLIFALRTSAGGRIPFANSYEFTLLFSGGTLLLAIFVRRGLDSPLFDLTLGLLSLLLLSLTGVFSSEIRPLMPALQSGWLYAHVATAIIAYALFALAACLGLLYLAKSREHDMNLSALDERIYKLVVGGFTVLSVVIITGAVWAEEVWGSWWSWDPKETWSLITWLLYSAYLHARRSYNWKGEKSAWMVIIGFAVVLFTLFGVSLLLPGLHSYL